MLYPLIIYLIDAVLHAGTPGHVFFSLIWYVFVAQSIIYIKNKCEEKLL